MKPNYRFKKKASGITVIPGEIEREFEQRKRGKRKYGIFSEINYGFFSVIRKSFLILRLKEC